MNENVFGSLNKLMKDREVELDTLKSELLHLHNSERLVDLAIDRGIKNGNIKVSETEEGEKKISLIEPFQVEEEKDQPSLLCLTLPPFDELGAQKKLESEGVEFLPIKESFPVLVKEAMDEIRICSPFLEKRAWDLYHSELVEFAERGGIIKVLTREIEKNDAKKIELQKIKKDFRKRGIGGNLKIADYYFSRKRLESSTHAKLLISDSSRAYVGSGEIRRNSLEINFEVGVILTGPIVDSIRQSFDYIFSVSSPLEE